MKRFVIRLLFLGAIMFLLDRGFGMAMKYLQDHAQGGYVWHHNYILHQANEDILIFGSSRAIHHYNPQIIEDSLGMSCYNCGQDGNGIVLFYGWWQMIKDRYEPKMIIYDVSPVFDLLEGEDNCKYLGWLRSEYENNGVKQVFEDIDPTEKYKMMSMMYRYNSKFLQNITDYFHPLFNISPNGYLPLDGEMDEMKIKDEKGENEPMYTFDHQKLSYMEAFIKDTKDRDIKLVFFASPIWYGMNEKVFVPLKEMCKRHGCAFYNYSSEKDYVHNNILFKDGSHLNTKGADYYTKRICAELK